MAEKDFRVRKGLVVDGTSSATSVAVTTGNVVIADGTLGLTDGLLIETVSGTPNVSKISSQPTNGNIEIAPNGTGDIVLDTDNLDVSADSMKISIKDDVAAALDITEGSNSYLKFVTTNSGEQIVFGQNSTFASTTIANLGTVSAATSITSTAFVGPIDGIVGGNTPAAGSFTSLDVGDGDITNVGDINADSISVDSASVGLTIDFSGANSTSSVIKLKHNVADALSIVKFISATEHNFIKFKTTLNDDQIIFGKNSTFAGTTIANLGTVSAATSITTTDFETNTLLANSHARINGTARETNTLLQVNGDYVASGGNLGGGGPAASANTLKYAEVRIHSDIANDDLAGMHVEQMGGVYIIDNAENASNTGQGSIYTVGRSGTGDAWGAGRQATTGKYAIGYINKDYDNIADGSSNPMRTAQATLEIDTSGNTTLAKNGAYLAFTGADSGANAREIRFKASSNGITASGDETYTLPVAQPASNKVLQSSSTGVLSWVAQSGGISVSGTDHRMVRMDGTTGLQDTGITVDDTDNITGVASLTAADLTTTNDITVGNDLITSDGSKIKPVGKTGTDVAGNTLSLHAGTGTGTGTSRIDFHTKSADGSTSTDAYSLSNTIVMKDGKLGIGTGVASDVSGNIITHHLTVSQSTSAEFVAMALSNRDDSNNTNGSVSMLFNLEDTGGNTVDSGKIKVVKNEAFTATGTTQDSNMEFYTSLNGTLTKRMEVLSDSVKVTGDLAVTGDLNITGDINSVSVTNLDVDDLTITLAKGAADSAAADGAGFSIDGASASMLYSDTGTKFTINKPLDITGNLNVTGTLTGDTSLTLDAVTITTAEIEVLDGVTAGEVTASRALVVDSSRNLDDSTSSNQINNLTLSGTLTSTQFSSDHGDIKTVEVASGTINDGAAVTIAQIDSTAHRAAEVLTMVYNDTDDTTDLFKTVIMWDGHDTTLNDAAAACHYTNYAVLSSGDVAKGDISAVKNSANIDVKFTSSSGSNDTYVIRAQLILLDI